MQHKKSRFRSWWLPYVLVAPQVIITIIFFILPAAQALKGSFYGGDSFGLHHYFVGLENFRGIFHDPTYLEALKATAIFSVATALLALTVALLLAALTHRVIRAQGIYKTLLIWPYAVAPAIAGILWRFIFNPAVGVLAFALNKMGYHWNYMLNAHQAMLLVVIAAAWQQFSYNYLFFLAGLNAIPQSLIQAAAIDGAGPMRRFWSIIFPLLSPTTFFLLIINLLYAFFDTFGIIQTTTLGGPDNATNILVYKVFNDGFVQLNLGSSYAQSVILMVIVIGLTVIQFRYIERKVHY
jgi:sn-glycerol 3-phosphate transport system permease protein